jgi:cilia- and flagella-associated protein 44
VYAIPLQGDIGKFGRVDLSDVTDLCVLADGKVVTTSESGFLLLWDGISIKTQVRHR